MPNVHSDVVLLLVFYSDLRRRRNRCRVANSNTNPNNPNSKPKFITLLAQNLRRLQSTANDVKP